MSSEPNTYAFILKSAPKANSASSLFAALLTKSKAAEFDAWLILDRNSGLVGYTELKRTEKTAFENERELIYAVKEPFRGNGHATRAVGLLAEASEYQISAYVNPQNVASIKVLRNNGFQEQACEHAGIKFAHVAYT